MMIAVMGTIIVISIIMVSPLWYRHLSRMSYWDPARHSFPDGCKMGRRVRRIKKGRWRESTRPARGKDYHQQIRPRRALKPATFRFSRRTSSSRLYIALFSQMAGLLHTLGVPRCMARICTIRSYHSMYTHLTWNPPSSRAAGGGVCWSTINSSTDVKLQLSPPLNGCCCAEDVRIWSAMQRDRQDRSVEHRRTVDQGLAFHVVMHYIIPSKHTKG